MVVGMNFNGIKYSLLEGNMFVLERAEDNFECYVEDRLLILQQLGMLGSLV